MNWTLIQKIPTSNAKKYQPPIQKSTNLQCKKVPISYTKSINLQYKKYQPLIQKVPIHNTKNTNLQYKKIQNPNSKSTNFQFKKIPTSNTNKYWLFIQQLLITVLLDKLDTVLNYNIGLTWTLERNFNKIL